jgi:steroid Delta-isomerase
MAKRCSDPRVERIVLLFENLNSEHVGQLGAYYAPGVQFKDPFNEVQGVPAVQAIFEHMFHALHEPRFVVKDIIHQGNQCFLSWDFLFRFKRFSSELQTVRGATHLRFDAATTLVTLHRDYWDAAEELYEKLPVVGGLMRWLKKRANQK